MSNNDPVIFYEKEIVIQDKSSTISILYCNIIGIYTDRPYAIITTFQHKSFHVLTSLSKIQKQLPPFFFRCSQSTIVNMLYIREYISKGRSLCIQTLHNKKESVSKSSKKEFIDTFFQIKDSYTQCIECIACKTNDNNQRIKCIE